MRLGACLVDKWRLIEVSAWEGLVIKETLTYRFLSYHPRVMGLAITSFSNEYICSAD
jgi:hypothetical protein